MVLSWVEGWVPADAECWRLDPGELNSVTLRASDFVAEATQTSEARLKRRQSLGQYPSYSRRFLSQPFASVIRGVGSGAKHAM